MRIFPQNLALGVKPVLKGTVLAAVAFSGQPDFVGSRSYTLVERQVALRYALIFGSHG
jgi:hypothetical protein